MSIFVVLDSVIGFVITRSHSYIYYYQKLTTSFQSVYLKNQKKID